MKLEEATINNTCECALTGKWFRVKLLYRMACNKLYSMLAVELSPDEIVKVYVWSTSPYAYQRDIHSIFYVKFGQQLNMDDITRIYKYWICDENGTLLEDINHTIIDDRFVLETNNLFR
jgi:hypothetical protein